MITYAAESKAELDKQTDATLSKNVKFDAYFEVNNKKTHYKTADLNKEDVNLVVSIDVQKEGYLKNATIDLKNSKEEKQLNYTITDLQDENAIVQSASENQLILRQVNSGKKIEFIATLAAGLNKAPSLEQLEQENVLTLKGLYIDGEGEETPIEKDIKINLEWTGKYEAEIKQSLIKYVPLEQEERNKTLISMQLETGLKQEKFMLPVQETKIEITAPIIAEEKPEEVTVTAISTEATNGLNAETVNFTEKNWNYNRETGKIEIKVNNEKKQNGQNKDQYIINYVYSDKVYEELKEKEVTIGQYAKVTIKTYSSNGTEETIAETEDRTSLNGTLGKLISLSGSNITQSIPKGQLYANINNPENSDKVEYEYKWLVNIAYTDGLAGILLEDMQERMNTGNTQAVLTDKTIYKQIIFNSNSFEELLGDEGTIRIYNKENRLLGIVAKDTRTDKEGNYLVELLEEVSQVKMVTSKPIKSGNIVVNVIKELKSDLGFTKSQIDNFTSLEATCSVKQLDEKTAETTLVEEKTVAIPLEASITKSQISINKEKLSTLMTNKDVEITIELGNDDVKSDLYVDPTFEIELPKCVENVEILESNIFFDEELIIDKVEFTHKGDIPVIRVMLDGIQTKFSSGVVTNGTNVVLRTNIKVNNLTPTSTEEIKMYYYNSNTKNYDNGVETDRGIGGLATTNIEFSAPTGMLAIGGITNYNGQGNTIMSVNQGELIEQVQTYRPSRTMKMHIIAINNTGNTADNIVIMGRVPHAGSKDIETGEEIGTTIDTYMASLISSESLEGDGIKIYYTENGEATSALGDNNNGWTLEPSNLDKVKAYMIVLENYEMPQGQMIAFNYDLVIPANIGYNQTINSNFGIYFINNTQVATVSSFAKSDIIGITTGRGPELEITQTVEGAENGEIDSYKVLKYTINVTNTGTEVAENVKIVNEIPKWTKVLGANVNLNSSDLKSYAQQSELKFSNGIISEEKYGQWLMSNFIIKESNYTDEVVVDFEYNEKENNVEWNLGNVSPGETVTKEIYVQTQSKPGIYEYYQDYPGFEVGEDGKYYIATSKYDPETETSYETKNEITEVPDISVKNVTLVSANNINAVLKSTSEEVDVEESSFVVQEMYTLGEGDRVAEGNEIRSNFGVTNVSSEDKKNVTIEKILPEGIEYVSAYITLYNTENWEEEGVIYGKYDERTRKITIQAGDIKAEGKISGTIILKASKFEEGIYEKEIKLKTNVYEENGTVNSSEEKTVTIVKPHYTVDFAATNKNALINEGDEIEYYLRINNVGKVSISNLNVKLYLPDEFVLNEAMYTMMGNEIPAKESLNGDIELILVIPEGDSITLKVKVTVGKVKETTSTSVYAELSGTDMDTEITEIIYQTIEKTVEGTGDNGNSGGNGGSGNNGNNNTPTERTYKIAGTAWLDENENGIRENNEKTLSNIKVVAIDANTGEIAKDASTGESVVATTSSDGRYLLTNLKSGSYLVVFKYDTAIYKTTLYQTQEANELTNSDAIEKNITENGTEILAGVTNTLNVNSTQTNIDIGLVERVKFDLSLEKSVKQITVQNAKGVKSYNYDNSKFAKVEISSKEYKNSTVVIEYIIKITNEGNAAGYAKQIIDYKPSELTFNSDLNSNWYEGTDGNIYTAELEKTLIQPGETKEVKLILTKKMNDTNSVMINNRAEIQDSIREQNLTDKESTTGNNAQGEDDIGLADIIITIQTGGPVFYSFITLISLIILAGGIYLIKIKTTKKSEEVYK